MIRLTSAGVGIFPACVCAYACITSAAVAELSAAAAPVPLAAQIGDGPPLSSAQPKNWAVFVLQSDQPLSPGATTVTVPGLKAVLPDEPSAAMLLFSQP